MDAAIVESLLENARRRRVLWLHDKRLMMDAELLGSEGCMIPVRFNFITPHHLEPTPFRVGEFYTGLRGQKRIKLVDNHGRVWYYDEDETEWLGVHRESSAAGRALSAGVA